MAGLRHTPRRAVGYVGQCDTKSSAVASPDWHGSGWYRFTGPFSKPPLSAPVWDACSTDAPGWLPDPLPTVAAGVRDTSFCFTGQFHPCEILVPAKMLNCGDHYRFYLRDTAYCRLRYCGVP